MQSWKIILAIISLSLCVLISESKMFQVPDHRYELKRCTAIENGYEYNNLILEKQGVKPGDPAVNCWFTDYYREKGILRPYPPKTYGFTVRILCAVIMAISMYLIFEY